MIIGFLGTGAISEAIIRGLCEESGYQGPILVTQRSVERSSRLAHDYPQVEVIDNNNALVERSEWVFLGVLPEQVTEVLNALTFRPEQKLISLAAGISLAQIQALAPPCDQVIRAIPMPPIEFGLGPVALCPTDTPLEAFFSRIGTAVSVSDEQQFNLFGATSALMADCDRDHMDGITRHGLIDCGTLHHRALPCAFCPHNQAVTRRVANDERAVSDSWRTE